MYNPESKEVWMQCKTLNRMLLANGQRQAYFYVFLSLMSGILGNMYLFK